MSIENDVLYQGSRAYIPETLRQTILEEIHEGHPGIQRMKNLARLFVYWPKMDADLEKFVGNCEPCAYTARHPEKLRYHHWEEPTKPGQRVHIEHAGDQAGPHFFSNCGRLQ